MIQTSFNAFIKIVKLVSAYSCFCLWRKNYLFGNRYWNDPEVLKKLGEAMGMPVAGLPEQAVSSEPEAAEEGEEEESIVHQTASLGDVEVDCFLLC